MSWRRIAVIVGMILLVAGSTWAWDGNNPPPRRAGGNTVGAMWLSILHPGLGEWYNASWGGWGNCNKKKFWLGFIPFYGCPGYLQVRSAIDAKRGRTW